MLTALQIAGILLSLTGIAWVVMSHQEPPDTPHEPARDGVLYGMPAGLGQVVGLVLSKQGYVRRFFTIPGKCNPHDCRSHLHLDLGCLCWQNMCNVYSLARKAISDSFTRPWRVHWAELQRLTTVLPGDLDEAVYTQALAEGHAMTIEQAITYALELSASPRASSTKMIKGNN